MSLMSLVRWIGVVVIGWTIVAIGIGASGTRSSGPESSRSPRPNPRTVDAMPKSWPSERGYDLIDWTNGRRTPIRLPAGDRWSFVSISPWRDPRGELEAVGRWVNPDRDEFGGWAVFRLSDGAVLSRISTEVLPTGRPCWVPGQHRTILFAAGDGRLYRCRLDPTEQEPVVRNASVYASGHAEPSEPLTWEVTPPGQGEPMLVDPIWLHDSRLNQWIFATLMPLEKRGGRLFYGPPQLWWLEVSEDARAIVAAGRLARPTHGESSATPLEQRYPNAAVGPEGDIRLVYLERRRPENTYRLRSASVEFDSRTGRPRGLTDSHSPMPDSPGAFQPAPLLVSADGTTVFGLSPSGQFAVVHAVRPEDGASPGASPVRSPSLP